MLVFLAVAASVLLTVLLAKLATEVRGRRYRRYDGAPTPVPPREAARASQNGLALQRSVLADLFSPHHQHSIARQDAYYFVVALGVSALFVGFASLGLSLTVVAGRPAWLEACAAIDVVSFMIALACVPLGLRRNRAWVQDRTRAELLRQWYLLDELLLGSRGDADVTTRFEAAAERLKHEFPGKSVDESEVFRYWQGRRADLTARLGSGPIESERLDAYLDRRPRRQALWFEQARSRLEHQTHSRARSLAGLFTVAVLLALAKVTLTFHLLPGELDAFKPWLTLVLILVIGAASGLTGLYFGQNSRSLMHRYAAQRRRIDVWLAAFGTTCGTGPISADVGEARSTFEQILQFEDLMIEELVDWIAITSHDVIELAPA